MCVCVRACVCVCVCVCACVCVCVWLWARSQYLISCGNIFCGAHRQVSEGGHQIIAPFQLEDGRKILVARGWIPTTHRIPPVPEGKVTHHKLTNDIPFKKKKKHVC